MQTDHELLKLAAKAVGIPWPQEISGFQMQYEGARRWNPLADDGDALRLQSRFGLNVRYFETWIEVDAFDGNGADRRRIVTVEHNIGPDRDASTRRAIVRAVAEIAKTMQ